MMSSLSAHLFKPEAELVEDILNALIWEDKTAKTAHNRAVDLIRTIRNAPRKTGGLESFFQQYALNTKEGIALMCLAEALLRIPDGPTANDLIRDKIAGTAWLEGLQSGGDWMTRAAGLGLNLSAGTMNSMLSKLGEPVIRTAVAQGMKLLGGQFVLGQNINEAMKAAQAYESKGYRLSYDMLGEGARTAEDAATYFEQYKDAIERASNSKALLRPGLSVKLSALHPRYEFAHAETCVPILTDRLAELCALAMANGLSLTIDAEEVDRLELSIEILSKICSADMFKDWNGLGLAVQAYQKRALPLIEHLIGMARQNNRTLQVRLVKGAYWDTEVKRAQELGLPDYPVFTRKVNTDLCYLACVQKMLQNPGRIYGMFGTHNAHSVAAILTMAKDNRAEFEFQKLFGMGDALYDHIIAEQEATVSIYAPVGIHQDLLPYLVRRLLENGANSSFVNKIYEPSIDPGALAEDPVQKAKEVEPKHHPHIPLPEDLFGEARKNAKGLDLADQQTTDTLLHALEMQELPEDAAPLLDGKPVKKGPYTDIINPADKYHRLGQCIPATGQDVEKTVHSAQKGYRDWSSFSAKDRAQILFRIANLYEENSDLLMALCVREAGKTIPDALAEIREAVDFCRYYAAEGQALFDESGTPLPGPTGEENLYLFESRGVFACISPWNFPLAIFTGQIVAALMAGNAVIVKPAEQTPLIATTAIKLIHQAGIPTNALNLLTGNGEIGAALVDHPNIAGVAFTGSTAAAQKINRALAAKDGPIVPFIAETGGQNAMIVDSSALTEHVIDDVILSAFGSAGQRCSACRVLFIQNDVADHTIKMLRGAMDALKVGDPMDLSTDIGPIIDQDQLSMLQRHKSRLDGFGKKIAETPLEEQEVQNGHFFAPIAYEISSLEALEQEIFGPVLHVIRYEKRDLNYIVQQINETGYGLTFGVHSRIETFAKELAQKIKAGNIYINRSTIGAVVGSQPFGGRGLSGTGPKAGGPHYLQRFATEKVISTDTTAAGGNASLVMLEE